MTSQPKPIVPEPPFSLTDGERGTDLWRRLAEYMTARRDRLRIKNDSPLSPEETANVRGEIAALTSLIRLGTPRPPQGGR